VPSSAWMRTSTQIADGLARYSQQPTPVRRGPSSTRPPTFAETAPPERVADQFGDRTYNRGPPLDILSGTCRVPGTLYVDQGESSRGFGRRVVAISKIKAATSKRLAQRLPSSVIPQFDAFSRIMEAVSVLETRGELSSDTIDLSLRHVNYVKQAARLLGVISENTVLPVGRQLLHLPIDRQIVALGVQFEHSECGRAWLAWSKVSSAQELDPQTAEAFLSERTELPPSMVVRRGRTLRRWCTQIRSSHISEANSHEPRR